MGPHRVGVGSGEIGAWLATDVRSSEVRMVFFEKVFGAFHRLAKDYVSRIDGERCR